MSKYKNNEVIPTDVRLTNVNKKLTELNNGIRGMYHFEFADHGGELSSEAIRETEGYVPHELTIGDLETEIKYINQLALDNLGCDDKEGHDFLMKVKEIYIEFKNKSIHHHRILIEKQMVTIRKAMVSVEDKGIDLSKNGEVATTILETNGQVKIEGKYGDLSLEIRKDKTLEYAEYAYYSESEFSINFDRKGNEE